MISRTAYNLARQGMSMIMDRLEGTPDEPNQHAAEIIWDWFRPYVVVIHRPTGNGYYLDRKYRHIVSVANIEVPTKWVERELNHQAAGHGCSHFEQNTSPSDFDSYWLY